MERLGINIPWLVTQLVDVIVILIILRALAFRPIMEMLATRKRKIQESLEYADKVKAEAASQQKEFERRLDEARRESAKASELAQVAAQKEREVVLAQAREEAHKIVEAAQGQIEYERKQMLAQLRDQVVTLSMLATQKVVGQVVDEGRQRQLINEFLTQVPELSGNGH